MVKQRKQAKWLIFIIAAYAHWALAHLGFWLQNFWFDIIPKICITYLSGFLLCESELARQVVYAVWSGFRIWFQRQRGMLGTRQSITTRPRSCRALSVIITLDVLERSGVLHFTKAGPQVHSSYIFFSSKTNRQQKGEVRNYDNRIVE